MTTARPFEDVLAATLNVIPEDYPEKVALKQALDVIIERAVYTAPEAKQPYWLMAAGALESAVKRAYEEKMPWERTACDVFSARVDYRQYLPGAH